MRAKSDVRSGTKGRRTGLPVSDSTMGLLRMLTIIVALAAISLSVYAINGFVQRSGDTTPRTAAERALLDAKKAIKDDPRDVAARMRLAKVYIGLGRTRDAERVLVAAAKIETSNVEVAHLLGLAYLEAGDHASAIKQLKKAAAMKDGYAEQYAAIHADLGKAYAQQGQWKQASAAYESAVGYAPEAANLVFELGQSYEHVGRIEDARAAYEGVLKFVPDHKGAAAALAGLPASRQ